MPQLDTSTWFVMITPMIFTLFTLLQFKLSNSLFPMKPEPKSTLLMKQKTPWQEKWTKIYLPHSLPLQ